jgi:hypothetical protein
MDRGANERDCEGVCPPVSATMKGRGAGVDAGRATKSWRGAAGRDGWRSVADVEDWLGVWLRALRLLPRTISELAGAA